ncbi:MAG: hypothetical protein MZV64_10025 [Ignavibacteriales bacterium]|nr:hypothetical protein [Ignavibacteriales bacterium]
MPPLKPLIERASAIHVGQTHVTLLDQSERRGRDAPVAASVLNYGERVAERETLRFHCTEALRAGDYAGAYGLARRAGQCSWLTRCATVWGRCWSCRGNRCTSRGAWSSPSCCGCRVPGRDAPVHGRCRRCAAADGAIHRIGRLEAHRGGRTYPRFGRADRSRQ